MRKSFYRWAVKQLKDKARCAVEPSLTCLPLRNDPICRACYEGHVEEEETADAKDKARDIEP